MVKVIIVLLAFLAFLGIVRVVYLQTVAPARKDLISADYRTLKEDFLTVAGSRDPAFTSFAIDARDRDFESLTIDVAWIGPSTAKKVLLHISGTHGVEGYAGSAIQKSILEEPWTLPEDTAVVFVHAVNPWGMANRRRVNESNVDLNRNAFTRAEDFAGSPEGYRAIEAFLNRPATPSRVDFFYPEIVLNIARHGFTTLKQAIGGGQYEYPKGIYFGGKSQEQSTQILSTFFKERLSQVEKLFVIEIHSGLGDWGKDVLFWPHARTDPRTALLENGLGEPLTADDSQGVGFKTSGDFQSELPRLIPNAETSWIIQEFGAYGPVRTLRALRDENRYVQAGGHDVNHWSKQMLVEAFCPASLLWQSQVIERGKELFLKMIQVVDKTESSR